MKQRMSLKKALAVVLCLLMLASVVPMNAFAVIENYNKDYQSETHTVFKHTEQTLAPGVTNYTNYAYSSDGKQMVYYVTTADLTRDDVVAQVAYKDMQNDVYGMDKLSNMVACANEKYTNPNDPLYISDYYTVVSACNGDGYNMTTGEPGGVFIMGGNVKKDWNKASNPVFLAILKDGSAVIDNTQEAWDACKEAGIQEAIDVFGSTLVWDGKDVTANASGSYNTDRHSRTMVGITEDGKLVICVLDGRQEPFSCGGSMHELAQIMLEAGCVRAFNLDGGGSTTFMAKNEGTNDCVVINRPSDGSERSISNGIIIASTAVPSNTFDHVTISLENDYLVPGASVDVNVSGVSSAGTAADIPEDITYAAMYGTIENGVYVAGNSECTDTISAYHNGEVVGSIDINVVIPDSISITGNALSCPYGATADIDISLTKNDKNNIAHEVNYLPSNIVYSLSDEAFGTIDVANMTFTATNETLAVTKGSITASLAGNPSVSVTVPLQVGKGTSTVFDWEDGKLGNFDCFDYYNSGVQYSLDVVDKSTGKVHSGDYAMKFALDFSQVTYYEDYMDVMVQYNSDSIRAHGDTVDADGASIAGTRDDYIDITGACGIGFWVYIPDEIDVNGIDPRFFFGYKKSSTDTTWTRGTSPMGLWVQDRKFPTDNWYYYYADLSAYSSYYAMTLQNSRPLSKNGTTKNGLKGYPYDYYAGAMFEFYVNDRAWKTFSVQSYNSNFTLYIDDFMVDYSSVIPDRVAPEFSNVTYAYTGLSDATSLTNGTVIPGNDIDLSVSVTDPASGIDASSAKIYIDGNEMPATYRYGKLSLDKAVILADGSHIVKFEIADKQGNVQTLTRTFTVSAGNTYETVTVVPHNADLTSTLCGSLYYIDVNATDISKVQTVTTTLKVNNVNNWELDGMKVAEGFTVTTSTEVGDAGEVTLVITRTGNVTATGAGTLVSLPIRAWYPHNAKGWDSETLIKNNRVYSMDIQLITKAGSVEYVDGFTQECIGVFSAPEIQINNESQTPVGQIGVVYPTGTTSWHTHTVTALADQAATCTETGYTGRTFCEVCNSVVDWGKTVPATGHTYDFVDGVRKCTCGELFNGEFEGKTYVDGVVIADGWHGESYYVDGVKLTGLQKIEDFYYDFGDDGVCEGKATIDGFYFDKTVNAYRHFTAGTMDVGDVAIYPDVYFFDANGCAISGEVDIFGYKCLFSEKGAFVSSSDSSVIDAGYCGTNVYYVLLSNGTLMVDGEGVMKDYTANGGHFPAWVIKNDSTKVQKLFFGNGITEIGRFGFYRNGYLRSIEFESGSTLKTIGWGAFGHCWRLASVTLPTSVEELKEYAFYECGALKTVDFEEGSKLKSIGDYAFLHDIGLQSVYIPDNVAKIGVGAFIKANSSAVLNVVEGSVADLYATENGLLTVKRQGNVPPAYTGKCTDTISWELYPNGTLKLIGSGAMENYTSHSQQPWAAYRHKITKVVIDKDITSVGNYAFAYTQNLASVEFEEGSVCKSIGVLSFMNAAKLTEVVLPDTVDSISAYGFGCCYQLTSIVLPQGISYIYPTAFMNSDKVVLNVAEGTFAETFAINNNIEYTTRAFIYVPFAEGKCGENAVWQMFENGELRINGSGSMENYTSHTQQPWASFRHKIKKVVIGKDITSVGNYAFAYTQNLSVVEFEEGSALKSIGVLSFMNAAKLTEIVLPDTVNSISAYGLGCCYELTSIVLPQGISYIYPTAFMNSDKAVLNVAEGTFAETFAINNNIAYTTRSFVYVPFAEGTCGETATWQLFENGELKINGSGAMANYTSHTQQPWANYRHLIKKVVIGKDITSVGNYAFAYTQNLASIEFEEDSVLKSIGVLSFMNAAKLTEVVLPDTVNSISAYGFGCCYQLTSVVLPQEISYIYPTAFSNSTAVTLNVASGSFAETYAINNGISYTTR